MSAQVKGVFLTGEIKDAQDGMKGVFSTGKIKDTQGGMISASVAMQGYAHVVLQQPDFNLAVLKNLSDHQKTAQDHAKNWQDNLHPSMISTNADIIDYANQFQSFYDTLRKFAGDISNPDSKKQFIEGLQLLQNSIDTKHTAALTMTDEFKKFNTQLESDKQHFESDFKDAKEAIKSDDGEIPQLEKRLDAIHSAMKKDTDAMAGGAALIGVGAFVAFAGIVLEPVSFGTSTILVAGGAAAIAGGVVLRSTASEDYSAQLTALKSVTQQLAKDRIEFASLRQVKSQLNNFSDTFTVAIAAAQSLADYWQSLGKDIGSVTTALQQADETIDSPFLLAELDQANRDWNVALEDAKKLQPDGTLAVPTKFYEDLQHAFKPEAILTCTRQ